METPWIMAPGTYCFEYSVKLENAQVWSAYTTGGRWKYPRKYANALAGYNPIFIFFLFPLLIFRIIQVPTHDAFNRSK